MAHETSALLTYRDYVVLPDDGKRYEIHDGELSVTPSPGTLHQRISRELLVLLDRHVKAHELGEVFDAPYDIILSDRTVVQPDLVFIARDREHLVSERGVEGAPTLAIEILSPATVQIDRVRKRQLYARHGVPFYWLVDPEARVIEAFLLTADGYTRALRAGGAEPVSPPPFEGLALVPDAIWA